MRRYLCFTLLLLGACTGIYKEHRLDGTQVVRWKRPPGTLWLKDSLYILEHEVTNLDYNHFMNWVNLYSVSEYAEVLPDTLVWQSAAHVPDSFTRHYLRHPRFQNYPVVGVSLSQANAYCAWISLRVNEMLYVRFTKEGKKFWGGPYGIRSPVEQGVSIPITLRYRLPTREEWEYAALAGNYSYINDEVMFRSSVIDASIDLNKNDFFVTPVKVGQSNANRYSVKDLLGNVSELTSDSLIKGLNFLTFPHGGSPAPDIHYIHSSDSSSGYTVKSYMPYKKPAAWLGFRCVCEVLP